MLKVLYCMFILFPFISLTIWGKHFPNKTRLTSLKLKSELDANSMAEGIVGSDVDDGTAPQFLQPKGRSSHKLGRKKSPGKFSMRGRGIPGGGKEGDDEEIIIGYPDPNLHPPKSTTNPDISRGESQATSSPGANSSISEENSTTTEDTRIGAKDFPPGLKYFMDTFFPNPKPELVQALKEWHGENEHFASFCKQFYSMSSYEISWRGYSDQCLISAAAFRTEKITKEIPITMDGKNDPTSASTTKTDDQKDLWEKTNAVKMREGEAVAEIVNSAVKSELEVGRFGETIHDTLVILRKKKTKVAIQKIDKNMKHLYESSQVNCNHKEFLVCNPYFNGSRPGDENEDLSSFRSPNKDGNALELEVRPKMAIFGQCDCRQGFEFHEGTCFVKAYEDCNKDNLFLEKDLRLLPVKIGGNIPEPRCLPGYECLNGLVCVRQSKSGKLDSLPALLLSSLLTGLTLHVFIWRI